MRMEPGRPVYFVQAPSDSSDYLAQVRSSYRLSQAPAHTYALLAASSLTPMPLTPRPDQSIKRHILASDNYPYLRGFNDSEGSNGRWLSDDNLILLTPKEGDHFELTAYALPQTSYLYPEPPEVLVSFNGCRAPAQNVNLGVVSELVVPMPDHCGIKPGQPVNVRIEINNLLDVARTRDPRPLAVLGKKLGFTGPKR
jgi:hypothetical protein